MKARNSSHLIFAVLIGIFVLGAIFTLPLSLVWAQSGGTVTVTATVPSRVDADLSTVVTDLNELPADDVSSVIITVTIKDNVGTVMANIEVTVTSNRGAVDTIKAYAGSTLTSTNSGTSDSNGVVRFAAHSAAPGQATFTAVAESLVTLKNKPTVNFTPLPVLQNLTIKVKLPGGGELTILEPPKPKTSQPANPADKKLVNTQIGFQIPFWVFLLIIIFVITEPLLLAIVIAMSHRMKKSFAAEKRFEAKEQELLQKIYTLEGSISTEAKDIKQETARIEQTLGGTPVESTNAPIPPIGQSLDSSTSFDKAQDRSPEVNSAQGKIPPPAVDQPDTN